MNAAYFGSGHIDLGGFFCGKKGLHSGLVGEVHLGVGLPDYCRRTDTVLQQLAHDGTADHATVAGNIDFLGEVHGWSFTGR